MKKIKIQLSFSRKKEVGRLRSKLERESFPRIQMFLLVSLTSGVAFLLSYTLLHLGLYSMAIRYLTVCILAYGFFLLLLWFWLRGRLEDYEDISDLPLEGIDINTGASSLDFQGAGGQFGGGGATGAFDEISGSADSNIGEGENPLTEALGSAGEAEEFALPLVVFILIVTILLSSFFVIYSAPILFAELMVDSLLAAGLYKKMKGVETNHWLTSAIRRTIFPILITTAVAVTAGFILESYAPKAKSLGDIIYIIKDNP